MTVSYAQATLDAGTVGGRGFWIAAGVAALCRQDPDHEVDHPVHDPAFLGSMFGWLRFHNTRDYDVRALEDADTVEIKSLLQIDSDSRLTFFPWTYGAYASGKLDYMESYASLNYPRRSLGDGVGATHIAIDGEYDADQDPAPYFQHASRVQFLNTSGNACAAARKIDFNTSGSFDTLPGLYECEIIAGEVDYRALTCKVSIKSYSNERRYWKPDETIIYRDLQFSNRELKSQYLSESITVSFAENNWNINLIPGVKIQFNTALFQGNKFVIAVGYEYVNGRSDLGNLGDIYGFTGFFLPLICEPINPWFYGVGRGETVFRQAAPATDQMYATRQFPTLGIFNVSGQMLTGCKLCFYPFVRLEQKRSASPFSQWFMGAPFPTQLTASNTPYRITLRNVHDGLATLTINDDIDVTIKEIDPDTWNPNGMVYYAGRNLPCDGSTLLLWESMGIYFVLATDVRDMDYVKVHVRKGVEFIGNWDKQYTWDSYGAIPTPFHWTRGVHEYLIGGVGAIPTAVTWPLTDRASWIVGRVYSTRDKVREGDDFYGCKSGHTSTLDDQPATGDHWTDKWELLLEGDDLLPETYHTGVMQYQGYDFAYETGQFDDHTHWYDHYVKVKINGYYTEGDDFSLDDNPYEAALVVLCDDRRFFQVIPLSWMYASDQFYLEPDSESHSRGVVKASVTVGQEGLSGQIKSTVSIAAIDPSLVLRVNQIEKDMLDKLIDLGIEIGD
jgi:hypothetical protein